MADWSDSNLYAPKGENPVISVVCHFLDGKLPKLKQSNTILSIFVIQILK